MKQSENKKCRIVVDAMGGDYAPFNAVMGAISAFKSADFDLYLIGKKDEIEKVIKNNNVDFDPSYIINTSQVISMSESPTIAFKTKKESSIVVGTKLVKEGKADAFVSAGNTGAVSVSSIFGIGRIKGIARPALTAPIPNEKGGFTFLSDVGAFVDSKPQHLFGYAILSSIFIEEIYGIKNPKIGLLNVGEEEEKGYELTTETAKLLENSNLNYYGNVEGKDIFKGTVDLIICDGFVGNILLKFAESIIPFLKTTFKRYAAESLMKKLKVGLIKSPLKEALKNVNYENQGGLPLLGIDGISLIGHGSSSILAFKNMILRAKEMHDKNLLNKIKIMLRQYE